MAANTPLASVMDTLVESYNAKDFDKLRELMAPNLKFCHHNRNFEFKDRDSLIALMQKFAAEFMPDRKFGKASRTIESGNSVMREHRWGGTLRADVPGMGSAGSRIDIDLCTILVCDGKQIVEYHDYG
jgi:hypothetical protein